ncbi:sugar ABC transporter substrate-binding protein [Actinoallomurus sp. CA-142502]|uniref:sugar ABC transporter substrate-binding protein n=1 Tax=Actinoallomurus sp. CA-142502 TaxID=3239885 RepID=UPI003D89FD41
MKRRFPAPGPLSRSLAALVALTLAAAGCGSGAKGSGKDITIGLITKTDTNPFFVKMKEGAEKEAKAKGVKLMTAAGRFDGDNASQVTAMENMTAAGVKGILIVPSDTKAIVPSLAKARAKGIDVIALDTPPDPQSAADALFATNNLTAGTLIGRYAKSVEGAKPVRIAMLDLNPGITVGVLRHNGFLQGYGVKDGDPSIVCTQYTAGDQAKGQTAMENCLQKDPGINLVYTINEPAALGAYTALKAAGRTGSTMIVSIDGGCTGVKAVQAGQIAATAQQYPLKMAAQGVDSIVAWARGGKKASGYTDTGVNLITAKPQAGLASKDVAFGLANCWG